MMRSKTSIIAPTSTTRPVSSSTSRAHAVSSVSPSSTPPPGRFHSPFNGSWSRLTSTTRPSTSTTAPTPTTGRSGYPRSAIRHPPCGIRHLLGPHDLDDDAFPALAVELGVEDLLPWSQIEHAAGDRHHHLVAHQGALQVRVGVVFTSLVVLVGQARRRQLLEPGLEVFDQPVLPIVDVHAGGDVHRRDERHAVLDAALLDDPGHVIGDADELLPLLRVEPQVIGEHFHWRLATEDWS